MVLQRQENTGNMEPNPPFEGCVWGGGSPYQKILHFNVPCESGGELVAFTVNGWHIEKCVKDISVPGSAAQKSTYNLRQMSSF